MEKSNFFYLIFLVPLLFVASCKENDISPDTLPPITQEGLNTFGCYIDGELLVPKDGKPGFGSGRTAKGLKIYYRKDSLTNSLKPPYFAILASNYIDNKGDLIYIYIPSLTTVGDYNINESNGQEGIDSPPNPHVLANVYDSENGFKRYLSFNHSGKVIVTRFDTINTIYSGTFSLKMVDAETKSDTISVTEGRFDINWSTLNCGEYGEQECP